jgi:transposase, IS5 family
MKTKKPRNLFDEYYRLEKLSKKQDPLERLNKYIKWEIFRPLLTEALEKESYSQGGRPPYDFVLMFKVLILQRFYNISDEQAEYQILDRLSFMRFLGLTLSDDVPDHNTIWLFREKLTEKGLVEKLFELFTQQLISIGLIAHQGSIVDASFVEVPRQRNSRQENKEIKENRVPVRIEENPNVKSHKDLDARWTRKNNINYYGYKDHVKVCKKSKLIEKYIVTDASVHDSQPIDALIDESNINQEFYGDSAYSGKPILKLLESKSVNHLINEKGSRNVKLTPEQFENNRKKSKTRARVEHVFGFIEKSMHGSYIYTIGIERAKAVIGLINLTYNLNRYIQLVRI